MKLSTSLKWAMSKVRKIPPIISAIFFYATFTLAIFWDPIIRKFGSIQWDAISVHFFNLLFSSQVWHLGQLPLWTPYIFNGFPQIADLQVAVFYPANLLIGLSTIFSAQIMEYQIIFHYFLAGIFAFLFSRYINKNFLFNLSAGIIYGFSGFMVGHGSHVGMQNTATWLPLIFLLLILAIEKNKISIAIFSGFFLGIAILAGHFQISLFIAYTLGMYFIFDLVWEIMDTIYQSKHQPIMDNQTQTPQKKSSTILRKVVINQSPCGRDHRV